MAKNTFRVCLNICSRRGGEINSEGEEQECKEKRKKTKNINYKNNSNSNNNMQAVNIIHNHKFNIHNEDNNMKNLSYDRIVNAHTQKTEKKEKMYSINLNSSGSNIHSDNNNNNNNVKKTNKIKIKNNKNANNINDDECNIKKMSSQKNSRKRLSFLLLPSYYKKKIFLLVIYVYIFLFFFNNNSNISNTNTNSKKNNNFLILKQASAIPTVVIYEKGEGRKEEEKEEEKIITKERKDSLDNVSVPRDEPSRLLGTLPSTFSPVSSDILNNQNKEEEINKKEKETDGDSIHAAKEEKIQEDIKTHERADDNKQEEEMKRKKKDVEIIIYEGEEEANEEDEYVNEYSEEKHIKKNDEDSNNMADYSGTPLAGASTSNEILLNILEKEFEELNAMSNKNKNEEEEKRKEEIATEIRERKATVSSEAPSLFSSLLNVSSSPLYLPKVYNTQPRSSLHDIIALQKEEKNEGNETEEIEKSTEEKEEQGGILSSVLSSLPFSFFSSSSDASVQREGNLRGANTYTHDILNSHFNENNINTPEFYDYIVVGGGAVGCPLARTLADGGYDVLLIERGSNRTRESTPLSMDIYGAGLVVNDDKVSQLVVTNDGVRTHIGNVMGGGTAINVGIVIEETKAYFETLREKSPTAKFDEQLVEHAFDWVARRTANPMLEVDPYGQAWRRGLAEVGFSPMKHSQRRSTSNNEIYNAENGLYLDVNIHTQSPKDMRDVADYSVKLQPGHSWRSYSLFNHSKDFYRHASDVLLGGAGHGINEWDRRPPTLHIKTRHAVHRVHFDSSSGTPRATCVSYRPTTEADYAPILSHRQTFLGVPLPNSNDMLTSLFNPLRSIQKLLRWYRSTFVTESSQVACIKKGGRIILSAGAVLSPAILFKSGVGPRDQLEELGVQPVKEIKDLGQHFNDRVLIPVGVFFDEAAPPGGYPARICQSVGAKAYGPACDNYKLGDETLKCTLTTAEELSGGRIAEGIIYSTRYIFPPEWRDDPLMEYVFAVLKDCSESKLPYNSMSLAPMCALANPVISCFRRVAASFYFTAEPKSRGSVRMKRDGSLIVDANYMRAEQDLFDAVRGLSNIIRIVNSDVYKGIIQPISDSSCPVAIMNGFLDLVLHVGAQTRPYVFGEPENFYKIVQHMEDLIPQEYRRSRRLMVENEMVDVNHKNAEKLGLHRRLQEIFNIRSNDTKTDNKEDNNIIRNNNDTSASTNVVNMLDSSDNIINNNSEENVNVEFDNNEEKRYSEDNSKNTCDATDVYNFVYGCDAKNNGTILDGQLEQHNDTDEVLRGETFLTNIKRTLKIHPSRNQWAATYPPVLPDPANPVAVAKYALEYMTSIWHHTGTAQFGKVVNENFDIMGMENVSIVDASVLNFVTRMNPTATLMMLGRYAGLLMLRNRNVQIQRLMY